MNQIQTVYLYYNLSINSIRRDNFNANFLGVHKTHATLMSVQFTCKTSSKIRQALIICLIKLLDNMTCFCVIILGTLSITLSENYRKTLVHVTVLNVYNSMINLYTFLVFIHKSLRPMATNVYQKA